MRTPLPDQLLPRRHRATEPDKQTALYREGKRLEALGNELLRKAEAKFAEAYSEGFKDGDIGVDSLMVYEDEQQ
jgi:hypothetical protein